MSGVEVAGVVLGGFPILISALEHWQSGAKLLQDWWQFRREYQRCLRDIGYHELAFRRNLEECLLPLIADDDEVKTLLADPAGPGWSVPELEEKLEKRLSKSAYEQYKQTIDGFTFDKSTRKALFEELAEYNTRLHDLLDTSDRISASRATAYAGRAKASLNKSVLQSWKYANGIFNVIKTAWTCHCQRVRHVDLLLRHPSVADYSFRMVSLIGNDDPMPQPQPWTWRETDISMVSQAKQSPVVSIPVSQLARTPRSAISIPSTPRPSIVSRQKGHPATQMPATVAFTTQNNTIEPSISNLCEELGKPNVSNIEQLKDDVPGCNYTVIPIASKEDIRKTISLERLLARPPRIGLKRSQRFFIAFTIASSHIQLQSTPWLGGQWSKADILFPCNPQDSHGILADQPFLSCNFASSTAQPSVFGDTTFSTLGILLLELCFGMPFESTEFRQRSLPANDPNTFSDLGAATELAGEVLHEVGQEYADAVAWCLTRFMVGTKRESWRHELLVNVVEPLQKCHQSLL
ncbi:uncharacterized protein BDZ99DRAFT_514269 [Mytilinidion resinicola]|uniref:DUF7580 domain-containing protein n=1 Tax=Mytilinidion resinicola TaxID=574789 RepID=A0A6A6Z5S2_9PEZI|nr:uncharacterized protein BDZ99DRAFT_514269 [Mytilinidion resinicola]KAF2815607.1 hypothetical protein BDZ99DRAFT_514269 [Mytilinidion resinicola]